MLKQDTPLQVATASYAAGDLIVASRLAPVATSVGLPKFPLPYRVVDRVGMVCPFGLLDIADQDEFIRRYLERLERYGAAKILPVLARIAQREQRPGVALLCFENVAQGEFCHRRVLAEWLEERAELAVPELSAAAWSQH